MENKFFIPNVSYNSAIKEMDKGALKALLVGIVGADPTFATSEYVEACQYITSKSLELGNSISLEEKYAKQEDEYKREDDQKWTEEYYQMNLVWLRDNFSTKVRLPHIKEVGKMVYKNKNTMGKTKARQKNANNNVSKKEHLAQSTVGDNKENWLQPTWMEMLKWIGEIALVIIAIYALWQIIRMIRG